MWKTSTMPSAFTLSMAVLNAQKAPVRPIPALKEGERERKGVNAEMLQQRGVPYSGKFSHGVKFRGFCR